jgi:hypothetical protein
VPSQQYQPPQALMLHEELDVVDVVAVAVDVVTTLVASVVRNTLFSNNDKRMGQLAQVQHQTDVVKISSICDRKKLCHVLTFITISFP